jgi:hypothetical protein
MVPCQLTPDDFRRDLNEQDLRQIRQQLNADRIRSSWVVELTFRSSSRPLLEAGECVWLDQYQIVGRYEVVIAERSYSGHGIQGRNAQVKRLSHVDAGGSELVTHIRTCLSSFAGCAAAPPA